MQRRGIALLLALAIAAAPAAAAGSSLLDRIATRGFLRVGSTGDYRPFSYEDPRTRQFSGFDIDMARSLAAALGVRLAIVRTSWPGLMADLRARRFDLAMGGISVTGERRRAALFSRPYLTDGKVAIARCAERGRFIGLAAIDRPQVRVVVNPGGTNERFVRDRLRRAAIIVHPDNATIFDEIAGRRADVMITDASEARLQQRLHPGLCAIHPDRPFNLLEKAYLLPQDAAFKAAVDRWLGRAMADGELARTAARWLY